MQSTSVSPARVPVRSGSPGLARLALGLIVVAAILVGVAIILDSSVGRMLSGLGAAAWVGGAVLLLWSLRSEPRAGLSTAVALVAAVVLAVLVRPNDLVGALIGFGVAGIGVALIAPRRPLSWAVLVPALYLPAHLIVAISRSVLSGSVSVRTEPPPTAPFVPLVMVLVAALAGWVIGTLRDRRV